MASDLHIDTQRLQAAAGQLDDAVAVFRRPASEPPVTDFVSTVFGTSGAAVEAAAQIVRRLRHGSECAELLSQRSRHLADTLRATAIGFDRLEAELAGESR